MANSPRILVVDDEETVRKLITMVLQSEGYAVDTASNGLEALKAIDTDPPALVIADIMMPELSGLELVEGLRHHPHTNALPIIFITASDDPKHFAQSVNLKARQFISKPFANDDLLAKVRRVVGPPTGA